MTTITAKVIQKSKSKQTGQEIVSVECRLPRIILAELLTHRVFSRNSSSSRAIPISKMLNDIINDPFIPVHVGAHQKGMQASLELAGWRKWGVLTIWKLVMWVAVCGAWTANKLGVHKQVINRMIEPWSHITVLITATDWNNFYNLRRHPDAEPHIKLLADAIYEAIENAAAFEIDTDEWHVPYVGRERKADGTLLYWTESADWELSGIKDYIDVDQAKLISSARCASTSYKTVDGKIMDKERALLVADKLIKTDVIHASPFEHIATPDIKVKNKWKNSDKHGNLNGYMQYRKFIPNNTIEG
jgi:hypothetical protein